MGTVNLTVGGPGALPSYLDNFKILRVRVDMRTLKPASAEIDQLFNVKAGQFVNFLGCHILQLEGAALTVDIGDGSTDDGFADSINLNSASWVAGGLRLTEATPNTITGYSGGKLYTADDTVDMVTNSSGADTAVIDLYFLVIDLAVGPAVV